MAARAAHVLFFSGYGGEASGALYLTTVSSLSVGISSTILVRAAFACTGRAFMGDASC